jgi:hypothetical protein
MRPCRPLCQVGSAVPVDGDNARSEIPQSLDSAQLSAAPNERGDASLRFSNARTIRPPRLPVAPATTTNDGCMALIFRKKTLSTQDGEDPISVPRRSVRSGNAALLVTKGLSNFPMATTRLEFRPTASALFIKLTRIGTVAANWVFPRSFVIMYISR